MRRAIIFISVLVVIIAAVALYTFIQPSQNTAGTTGGNTVTDFFSTLFPFGGGNNTQNTTGGNDTGNISGTGPASGVPQIRQIGTEMIVGARFVNVASSTPIIRYMERKTGHIYEIPADSYTATRITNTTVPGIDRMVWLTDTTAILESLTETGVRENLLSRISTTTQTMSGSVFPPFARIAVLGNGTLMLATERASGVLVESARADGSNKQTLFASQLRSWIPLGGGTKTFLATAPTASANGYVYQLNNGALTKVAGDMPGLMAIVSPSGRYLAYSAQGDSIFRIMDTEKKNFYEIPIKTFAQKCAWVPHQEPALVCGVPKTLSAGTYPDDWLMGKVATADTLWRIDPVKGIAQIIADPSANVNTPTDITNVAIDDTDSYVLFTNKDDLTLWSVQITK